MPERSVDQDRPDQGRSAVCPHQLKAPRAREELGEPAGAPGLVRAPGSVPTDAPGGPPAGHSSRVSQRRSVGRRSRSRPNPDRRQPCVRAPWPLRNRRGQHNAAPPGPQWLRCYRPARTRVAGADSVGRPGSPRRRPAQMPAMCLTPRAWVSQSLNTGHPAHTARATPSQSVGSSTVNTARTPGSRRGSAQAAPAIHARGGGTWWARSGTADTVATLTRKLCPTRSTRSSRSWPSPTLPDDRGWTRAQAPEGGPARRGPSKRGRAARRGSPGGGSHRAAPPANRRPGSGAHQRQGADHHKRSREFHGACTPHSSCDRG